MIAVGAEHFASLPRFVVRRRLGAGGMGIVFEAFDTEREATVALKTLPNATSLDLYRFKNEFRSLANLAHPNLVTLYELISDGNRWFFSMEYIQGGNFLEYVRPPSAIGDDAPTQLGARSDTASATGRLPDDEPSDDTVDFVPALAPGEDRTAGAPERTTDGDPTAANDAAPTAAHAGLHRELDESRLRSALGQLVRGIDALHRAGFIHRDLKPSNVMVDGDGRLVILDFGLVSDLASQRQATLLDHASEGYGGSSSGSGEHTDANLILGTALYMSPEQSEGNPLTTATDWYSLGVMLYAALTGKLPFIGKFLEVLQKKREQAPKRPDLVCPGIPSDLASLCMRLLSIEPKERPEAAEILDLLGMTGTGARAEADRRGIDPLNLPLFGRESHMAALRKAIDDLRAGSSVSLFLHGRSGAGKSTLVHRFLDDLEPSGQVTVLKGRCFEAESVPYKAMDTLVDDLSRFLNRLDPRDLGALLPPDMDALANVFPVLHRVDAIADGPPAYRAEPEPDATEVDAATHDGKEATAILSGPHDFPTERTTTQPPRAARSEHAGKTASEIEPRELRRKAFKALRSLLKRIGRDRNLVLWIDDLQWGDLDSATILTELISGSDPPRFLLLACYRSEYADSSPCLQALQNLDEALTPRCQRRTLAVEPLDADEAHALALSLLGGQGPKVHEQAAAIARESQGSPFFIQELVRHVRGGSALPHGDTPSSPIELDAVLWNRVQALPEHARSLLELVAVAGQPTTQRVAVDAAGLRGDDLASLHLLRAELLVRTSGPRPIDEVETYHDRIRESILARLDGGVKVGHHRRLATTLQASGEADPQTLAIHFESASDASQAQHYYLLAADQATSALAFDRAAKLYQKAMMIGGIDDEARLRSVRTRHAHALANAGRGAEAAEQYLKSANSAPDDERIELERRAAYQYCISGRTDEGRAVLESVLGRVGMTLPKTPGRTLVSLLLGRIKLKLRGLSYTSRDAEQVLASELTRIEVAWAATAGLSMFDILGGADFQTRNLLLSLRAGEPFRIARALAWEAAHAALAGGPGEANTMRLLETSRALAHKTGEPQAHGMVAMAEGTRFYFVGRWHEARVGLEKAETIFREQCTGVAWELDSALAFLIWALVFGGEFDEMRRRAAAILQDAEERGDLYASVTQGCFCEPMIRLMADDVDGARERLRYYLGRYPHRGYHAQDMLALMSLVQTELYDRKGEVAWAEVQRQWPDLKKSQLLSFQLLGLHMAQHRARAALASSETAANPAPLLDSAARDLRTIEKERMPWSNACGQLLRAALLSRKGHHASVVPALRNAASALDAVGMPQYSAAARYRLGEILGGHEGEELVAGACRWMSSQGIARPDRMVEVFAPGFVANPVLGRQRLVESSS